MGVVRYVACPRFLLSEVYNYAIGCHSSVYFVAEGCSHHLANFLVDKLSKL